jgi:hypothetical protein
MVRLYTQDEKLQTIFFLLLPLTILCSEFDFSFFTTDEIMYPNGNILVTLEESFENLKRLAEASGAIEGIELLRTRPSENVFMCGVKGTLQLIEKGEYPASLAES